MSQHKLSTSNLILEKYKDFVENNGSGDNVLYTLILNGKTFLSIRDEYYILYPKDPMPMFLNDIKLIHKHTTVTTDFFQSQSFKILVR